MTYHSHLLDLLSIFIANEDDNRVDMNTVEPLNGMRSDVQQTVTVLETNRYKHLSR